MSFLFQGVNLVSFFSGEVCVVHLCNFDWSVKKARCYRISPPDLHYSKLHFILESANKNLIDKWKIYIGRAAPGTGNRDTYPHKILSTPFIGEPGSICTETYLLIGPFDTQAEAESALSYLTCQLTRLLILLHKPSQDTTRKVYTFVPIQSWDRKWSDADLYAKYGISESEIEFIRKIVRPMDLNFNLTDEITVDELEDD